MQVELLIETESGLFCPVVLEGIRWETVRRSTPGKLSFSLHDDGQVRFEEGAVVRLRVDEVPVFYGYLFSRKTDRDGVIDVVAYDQLRYLENQDTYVYENKKASEVLRMVAADFKLEVGSIAGTEYTIPSRVEENTSLFDVIENALDLELACKGNMFVLYDDFGKLTLKNIADMQTNVLIEAETAENFSYDVGIDGETYNRVKLYREDEDSGEREVHIAQDAVNIGRWGILQYSEAFDEEENGRAKAEALLQLYNVKERRLSVQKAAGSLDVRAGSMVVVHLNLGDVQLQNYMIVEKCGHLFEENAHFMDLDLRGGEFVG